MGVGQGVTGSVLTVNVGSGTVKLGVFEPPSVDNCAGKPAGKWRAQVLNYTTPPCIEITSTDGEDERMETRDLAPGNISANVASGIEAALTGDIRAVPNVGDIAAVVHRVVHGGRSLVDPVLVTGEVRSEIEAVSKLAPLHNVAALAGMDAVSEAMPDTRQIAVFDTGFHQSMSTAARIYPGPYEWFEEGLVRFGFHGISHQEVARSAARVLGRDDLRVVSCHLGGGCSVTAIESGRSIDTTMGLTPMEGLMMAERSGSVDPGLMLHLMSDRGMSAEELDHMLNHESGLRGLSGISGDIEEVQRAARGGHERAGLALEVYERRIASAVASMAVALDGIDVLAFSGGAANATVRASVCDRLSLLGVSIDAALNEHANGDAVISDDGAPVETMVLEADEERALAAAGFDLLSQTGD